MDVTYAIVPRTWYTLLAERLDLGECACAVWCDQRVCGRWLSWRRLQMAEGVATAAQQSGIGTSVLQLAEAGLAKPEFIDRDLCVELAAHLAPSAEDTRIVQSIVELACGYSVATPCHAVLRAQHDLCAQHTPTPAGDE